MILVLTSLQASAYYNKKIYKCANGEELTVEAMLMPLGDIYYQAYSSFTGHMERSNCDEFYEEWSRFVMNNCYANEDYMFSHDNKVGTIFFNDSDHMNFSMCLLTKETDRPE